MHLTARLAPLAAAALAAAAAVGYRADPGAQAAAAPPAIVPPLPPLPAPPAAPPAGTRPDLRTALVPVGRARGSGSLRVFGRGTRPTLVIRVQRVRPVATDGLAHGVWLRTPRRDRFLGFLLPRRVESVTRLAVPVVAGTRVLVTRERSARPERPGRTLLAGALRRP